ncbi:MAG: glycerol-3-phosphate 1-O-acyltransferase PlsY [Microcoleaceae cyanobacterium]
MAYWFLLNGGLLITAYFLGALAPGFWIAKGFYGIDLREQGSGSTGSTNVLRNCGKVPALIVLAIDLLKGTGAVALVAWIYSLAFTQTLATATPVYNLQIYNLQIYNLQIYNLQIYNLQTWADWMAVSAALIALIGHTKSVWINFKGGKAVATGLGVLFGLNWTLALATAGIFLLSLGISRIVSLSSLAGALGISMLMILTKQPLPYQIFAAVAAIYIFWLHKGNIERLLKGTEPQIGQKLQSES